MKTACQWIQDDDGVFDTGCGERFVLDSGTPDENGFNFCCYCGKKLAEVVQETGGE